MGESVSDGPLGNVYLESGDSRIHPSVQSKDFGLVFRVVKKSIVFGTWRDAQPVSYRLEALRTAGYHFFGPPPLAGIFVPSYASLGAVAADLRREIGFGTVLLDAETTPARENCERALRIYDARMRNDLGFGLVAWYEKHVGSCGDSCSRARLPLALR